MRKVQVFFRVDGNAAIGLGHLIRSLALARMLDQCFSIHFLIREAPEAFKNDLNRFGFECTAIHNEAEWIMNLQFGQIVVVDNYTFDIEVQRTIRQRGAKLVCIDDLGDRDFDADLIINHAPDIEHYIAQPYTKFALGTDFALLRPEFLKVNPKKRTSNIETLFICFGGSDFNNCTLESLQAAVEIEQLNKIDIVIGASYLYKETLSAYVTDKRVNLHHDVNENQIVKLLMDADVAIVPASGILYEAVAISPIIISGTYTNNQEKLFAGFSKLEGIDITTSFQYSAIKDAITKALALEINQDRKTIIDGNSPKRINLKFYDLGLNIREASVRDCKLLFNWANDKAVRDSSIRQETITLDGHQKWFYAKLNSKQTKISILEFFGIPVGQIRYDQIDSGWEMDYSIDSDYRGMGLGNKIIEMTIDGFVKDGIKAVVKNENERSNKIFENFGFTKGDVIMKDELLLNTYYKRQQ
ncbi:MAG: UDP-2,4-diacetamido-2,4,6-trideoxy-beta-L-altropyranose hydrolase [Sphingobacteriaceae bacterium]|nr:UDP-2,4-diacetamido-2,4,6-trideoxy-beta-L-altropyranose hydrolase [Sphingobacteriaceae bacterium]